MHEQQQESQSTHSEGRLMPYYCLPLINELIHWPDPFLQSKEAITTLTDKQDMYSAF